MRRTGARCIATFRYPSAPSAWREFAVRGSAIRSAFGRVIPPAVVARQVRAPAEESLVQDSQAGFPAAVPSVAPAESADLLSDRSALCRHPHQRVC